MSTVEAVRRTNPKTHVALRVLALAWMLLPALGCGPLEEGSEPPAPPATGVLHQELLMDNGLSFNGLSFNGLSFNGLSFNGLSFNGLGTTAFKNWFSSNPALANQVMHYVVACALPDGQVRTYRDATSGQTFTWSGELGLTPGWAGGAPATVAEQQLISACLAAHVNKYGASIPISVLGRNAQGIPIPYTLGELGSHPKQEACFFGNLFTGQGIYVGSEGHMLGDAQSTTRACSIASTSSNGPRTPCPPLVHVGDCSNVCSRFLLEPFYSTCRYGGVTYKPLTTRLRDQDIYTCGDGVCQVSESCGPGGRYDSCRADCGLCP